MTEKSVETQGVACFNWSAQKFPNLWLRTIYNQVTFPLGRGGLDSSKLSHLDLSMATISSACLASILSSCRLLQVISLKINADGLDCGWCANLLISEAGSWELPPGCAFCQCHRSKLRASGFKTFVRERLTLMAPNEFKYQHSYVKLRYFTLVALLASLVL